MHGSIPAEPQISRPTSASSLEDAEGIDVLDLILSLLRAKFQIVLWTFLFFVLGIGIALWLKPVFTATAVIMPPQQGRGCGHGGQAGG